MSRKQSIKMHTVVIRIREDQYQAVVKREDINLSGWVRKKMDDSGEFDE